jgi:hypothetical protein
VAQLKLKAKLESGYHILVSRSETKGAFNTVFNHCQPAPPHRGAGVREAVAVPAQRGHEPRRKHAVARGGPRATAPGREKNYSFVSGILFYFLTRGTPRKALKFKPPRFHSFYLYPLYIF